MSVIKLEQFSGIAPRIGPTELGPTQAQTAANLKLQSGEIRPWRKPVSVYTLGQAGVKTIYQLEKTTTGDKAWLEWTTDVDVVPSPVVDTTDFRIYYTDGVGPKKTNWIRHKAVSRCLLPNGRAKPNSCPHTCYNGRHNC